MNDFDDDNDDDLDDLDDLDEDDEDDEDDGGDGDDGDDEDDEPVDFFDDDDDDDDDDDLDADCCGLGDDDDVTIERCALAVLPDSVKNDMFEVESLKIEKHTSAHEDALVVSGHFKRRADGRVNLQNMHALLRDADGLLIGCEDNYVDVVVSDSADITQTFHFRGGRLAEARTVELRLEVEYKFKKLPIAAFKCAVESDKGGKGWTRIPLKVTARDGFPKYEVRIAGFVEREFGDPELELSIEISCAAPEFHDHGVDLLIAGYNDQGKRVVKEDVWMDIPVAERTAVGRQSLDPEGGALMRVRQIQLSAKGEVRARYPIGPLDLASK